MYIFITYSTHAIFIKLYIIFEIFVISEEPFPTKRLFKLNNFFFSIWIHILNIDSYFIYWDAFNAFGNKD